MSDRRCRQPAAAMAMAEVMTVDAMLTGGPWALDQSGRSAREGMIISGAPSSS